VFIKITLCPLCLCGAYHAFTSNRRPVGRRINRADWHGRRRDNDSLPHPGHENQPGAGSWHRPGVCLHHQVDQRPPAPAAEQRRPAHGLLDGAGQHAGLLSHVHFRSDQPRG
jgi:hypothetical protein